MNTLSDPSFAYILLLASIALVYFEVTHTGFVIPGVAGAVGIVISLTALYNPNVVWGGGSFVAICAGAATVMMVVTFVAFRTRRRGPARADLTLLGHKGDVVSIDGARTGFVKILGEMWKFESSVDQRLGDKVRVTRQAGLILMVEPVAENKQ